jgi:subtilisin family serine protease
MHYRIKSFAVFVAAAVPLALVPVAASAQDRVPAIAGEYVAGELLVGFAPGASSQDEDSAARSVGASNSTSLTSSVRKLRLAKGNEAAGIATLLKQSKVRYAEPNYIVHTSATPNDPRFSQLWGLRNTGQLVNGTAGTPGADISATSAWDISKGSASVVVGDVDTGIDYNHPDLAANVWSNPGGVGGCAAGTHGYNAINKTCNPMDDNNHGSHTAGTIGAVGNNGVGVVGVNWTTSLMGLKFLDASGSGSTADAITAIDFAVQAKINKTANVRALNNSWGGGAFSQALLDEINKAGTNDILFVAAAGNSSTNHGTTPTHYPCDYNAANMICVAASDPFDNLAYFSDWGTTTVHLAAPGTDILSTIPGAQYAYFNGTSMATPHVTGAVALILAACPTWTNADVKNAILNTNNVDKPAGLAGLTRTGGRLNVNKAIRTCAPPTPDFTLSASPASQTVVRGDVGTSYAVTITPSGGFTGSVTLSVNGLGTGATGTFSPNPTTTNTSTLSVTTTSTAATGTFPLTITGVSGSLSRTTSATLVVQAAPTPDFSLSASPSSQTVVQGASATYTVAITRTGGFTGAVTLSVSGLAAGATPSFSPNNTTGPSSTLTVTTTSTATTGTFPLTITGVSGTLSRTTSVTLVVNGPQDFSLTASPASLTLTQNQRGSYTVTITRTGGFAGSVAFSVTGQSTGTTATFSPSSTTGNSVTLNISESATAITGTVTLTITGVSGGLSHTTAVKLTVILAPPGGCDGDCG